MPDAHDDEDELDVLGHGMPVAFEVQLIPGRVPRGRIRTAGQRTQRDFHGWVDFMGTIHELMHEAGERHRG